MEDVTAKETDTLLDQKQPNEMYSVNFNSKDCAKEKAVSEPQGSGYWITVSNMMKSSIGSCVLSITWTFSQATLLPGILFFIIATVYTTLCYIIIIKNCEKLNEFTLNKLFTNLPGGKIFEFLCWTISGFCGMLSCATYIDLVRDTILKVSPQVTSFWLITIQTIVTWLTFYPLSLLELKDLWITSVLGILSVLYALVLIWCHPVEETATMEIFDFNMLGWCNVAVLGTQCYSGTFVIPPLYRDYVKGGGDTRDFISALTLGNSLTCFIYIIFAVSAYIVFGDNVEGDVLLNLPQSFLCHIARFGQLISVIGAFPLLTAGALSEFEGQFFGEFKNFFQRAICVTVFVLVAYIIALLIPDLGMVNLINACILAVTLVSVFPAFMGFYNLDGNNTFYIMFGIIGLLLGVGSFSQLAGFGN